MKLYKSYILAGLIALGLTACDTDDLERDINALKERVENYEAQVQKLNDDMNIIRVLLDGNKTICEWSYDGSTYTLKLSNGETLTLTDGVIGTNYPSIEIGENGNWIIAGEDSGIRAVANDGEAAQYTPQFKIVDGYWYVSYDNGDNWTNLKVYALGETTDETSPIKDVDTTTDPNYIIITLSDDSEYKIPVVKNLTCAIQKTDLADDGLLYFGYEETKVINVDVNIESGDIIRPVVPADWKAEIRTSNYSSLSGAQTLEVEVTAPNEASKCVITMEVNRGSNTITDEIVARTETKNYYDDYMAGLDLVVGDPDGIHMVINKKDVSLTVKHITNSSSTTDKVIKAEGIYFVDSDAEDVSYERFGLKNLIIIGTNINEQSKLTITDYFNLGKDGGVGLALKNINMDFSSNYSPAYVVNAGSEASVFDYVIFDKCIANLTNGDTSQFNFFQLSAKANIQVKNIIFYSNKFALKSSTAKVNLVNLASPASGTKFTGYENFICHDNVFYSPQKGNGLYDFSVLQANLDETKLDVISNLTVNNNTFVNIYSMNAMMRMRAENITSNSNLIWNDYDTDKSRSWLYMTKRSDDVVELKQLELSNNTVYDLTAKGNSWIMIHSNGYRPDNYGEYTFNYLSEDPFEEFDIANGTFKVSSKYIGIGSSLE